jgi:hypothetical protein
VPNRRQQFTALLTLGMVLRGFVGRFLYTSVPCTLDGEELGLEQRVAKFSEAQQRLASLGESLPDALRTLLHSPPPQASWHLPVTQPWLARRHRSQVRWLLRRHGNSLPALSGHRVRRVSQVRHFQRNATILRKAPC